VLAVSASWASFALAGNVPASIPVGNTTIPQWKSTPEDSATWRREPFRSTENPNRGTFSSDKHSPASASSDLALQGIMKSNSNFYAIINGITLKPGNRIEGWTVTGISRHRVTLRRDKETQIFDIYQGKIDRGTR
jgi:hypothetical protein